MKQIHRQNTEVRKHYIANKNSTGCGNAKLLYAGELKKTANWKEEMHSHDFCEIVYVKSGTGFLHTKHNHFIIHEGDLLVYAPHFVHSESSLEKEELSLYFCGIDDFHLKDKEKNTILTDDNPILRTNDLKNTFEMYFSLLIQELQTKSFYYDEISRSLVKIILNLILRLFAQKDAENFKTNEFYLCARKFIDENFQSIESIEDICKSVYISRYYLTHLFKEYSGISPVQYIISKRMEKAKQLLSDTSLSVHEIAELTGYTEETSFLRTFKKTENMTPSEFRKKAKK